MLQMKKKQRKSLDKIAKHVEVISINDVDAKNIVVTEQGKTIMDTIKPGVEVEALFRELNDLGDSDLKKKKRKEKKEKLLKKIEKKYNKQLNSSIEVMVLLYTMAKKFEDGSIVVLNTNDLEGFEEIWVPIFTSFAQKTLGFKLNDVLVVADEIKMYDGKKKKLGKFAKKQVEEVTSDLSSKFIKKTFKKYSILLGITGMQQLEAISIASTGRVTIKKDASEKLKRKFLVSILNKANENDKAVRKLIKNSLKEGRVKTDSGKTIKTFKKFINKADKESLIKLIVDLYITQYIKKDDDDKK